MRREEEERREGRGGEVRREEEGRSGGEGRRGEGRRGGEGGGGGGEGREGGERRGGEGRRRRRLEDLLAAQGGRAHTCGEPEQAGPATEPA